MPLCRSPLTLRLALFSRSRTAAVEIPRFILHRRRSEFLPLHRGAEVRSANAQRKSYTGEPSSRSVYRSAKWGAGAASAASHRIARVRTAVKPALAGCPHPSRHGAAPCRATFPKGKAKRFAGVGFEFILIQTVLLQRRPGRRAGGRPPVRPRR